MVNHFNKDGMVTDLIGMYLSDATLQTLSQEKLIDVFSNKIKADCDIYTDNASAYFTDAKESKSRYDSIPIDLTGLTNVQQKERAGQRESYWHELERAERILEGLETEVKEISEAATKEVTTLVNLKKEYAELNRPSQTPIANINILKNTAFSSAINETYPEKTMSDYKDILSNIDYSNDQEVKDILNATNAVFVGGVSSLEAIYKNKSTFENAITKLKTKKSSFDTAAGTVLNTANFNTYKTNLEAAEKLYNEFQEVNLTPRPVIPDPDIPAFKDAAYLAAIAHRYPENIITLYKDTLAESDYINDPTVSTELAMLNGLFSANSNPLEVIIDNKSEIEKKINKLKTKKASFDTASGTVLNTADFTTYKTDITNYNDKRKELGNYTSAPTDLNRAWLSVVKTFGKKFVNGAALTDAEKKNKDYKKISGAYLSSKIDEAYGTADFIENELIRINGLASRKDALKQLTTLQEDIDSVKDGVLETLNEELKDAYKNVIMGSKLDAKSNNTGEFDWLMFSKDNKIVEDHNVGTYAQGGIGMFQEMLLADPDLETEFFDLEKKVVGKHKRASSWLYGGFFNRKKNNRIGVDEALKLGLGYAVYLNHSEDIADDLNYTWRDIRDLHAFGASNSIEEIMHVYHGASKLGEKINDTTAEWTTRESGGYKALDNYINGRSGFSFKFVDTLWDFVGTKISAFTKKEHKYDVDISAIESKSHPHIQLALGLLGAGAIVTATADETARALGSDKSLSEKAIEALKPIGELGKEYFVSKAVVGEALGEAAKHVK
ncbi:MAG: hypothetical protein ABIF85_02400 [Nanoarchaeota archaeon]|nr:hypothetical protein [Nanoarchaeota archaeon]MBU4299973.1 hypothetical protein [Nanoarchaeota archaeon]MBU4452585.1 hypothetical protein [Nanoarchaeota archaeon]MCG2724069.1 hypothetical protein [archaeon]